MGLEFTRGNGARCPPFLVGGLMIMCLFLLCSWWSLYSDNFELLRQNDNLAAQLKMSHEEQSNCQNQLTQLEIQINAVKEADQEIQLQCQRNIDAYETKLETMKKERKVKSHDYDALKEEMNSLETRLKGEEKKVLDLQKELESKNERVSELERDAAEKTKILNDLEKKLSALDVKGSAQIDLNKPIAKVLEKKLKKNEDAGESARADQNEAQSPLLKSEVVETPTHDENNGAETKVDDAVADDADPREREMLDNANNAETS
ncbi:UNVERIFIED_CONTAM: hypothetical protein PYX00_000751 [Menopon gallinae]|uniref:Golgi membrane protein 1 n=1 Tax=Menopon gallinae TaxID=328185 RepID=A0AAW2IAH4_9NEOP